MKNSNKKRSLSPEFIKILCNSKIMELYNKNQKVLFLAVRNNYINLYYNCASLCKVEYHPRNAQKLSCYVHKKYVPDTISKKYKKNYQRGEYVNLLPQEVFDNYEKIIANIEEVYPKERHKEKYAQHKLVKDNNLYEKSNWYCIDIEYTKQRNNKKEVQYGRWDIIAISKKKNNRKKYEIALIELKCTEKAISGKSGILKHADDYIKFMGKGKNRFKTYKEHLKFEIKNIVDSLKSLKCCDLNINDVNEIDDEPQFYFITLGNRRDFFLKTMRKYIFKNEPGHARKTIENKHKIDITKENKLGFKPTFLFSDYEYDNENINDILDTNQYQNVGLNIRKENKDKNDFPSITIHRGTHQIGGCVTEITSKKGTRIAIDIGENLPSMDFEKKEDLLYIPGLTKKRKGVKNFDAVFVTHYHGDHIGLYNKILNGIKIYIGEYSKEIYKILQERLRVSKEDLEKIDNFEIYKSNKTIEINNDIKVTPIDSDHSAFDSHMLLIECDGKKILHTGDFRLHGIKGEELLENLKKIVGRVDYLICECTTLSENNRSFIKEEELEKKAENIFKQNKYNFVLCSSTNIDRIVQFYKAATTQGRFFLCDNYQKKILRYIDSIAKDDDRYHFDEKKIKDYNQYLLPYVVKNGFVMLVRANQYFEDKINHYKGSKFIYSSWDGYLEEKFKKQYGYLQEFVPESHEKLHTSGHANYEAIKKVVKIVKPKVIIPIHGENPNLFKTMGLKDCMIEVLYDKEKYYI